jgi:beta-1,4-mannosyltransferase
MSRLFFALFRTLLHERPEAILLQNPPSFPTLSAAMLAGTWLGATVIVDWHNYGFSLLALRLGELHWLVRLARWYEFRAGRRADAHLCVSRAMRADLLRHGIDAEVLYDRPVALHADSSGLPRNTAASNRMVAVCPAGWTADEDIGLLLATLNLLRDAALTVYITGDGVKRKELEPELQTLRARGVLVDTGFLPENEYWNLICRADLGLSLHRASSGLDLAMKVVDLYR